MHSDDNSILVFLLDFETGHSFSLFSKKSNMICVFEFCIQSNLLSATPVKYEVVDNLIY